MLVLNAAAPGSKDGEAKRAKEVEKGVRILKVALKAAKHSLDAKMVGETGLTKLLECAAEWEGRLKCVEEGPGDIDVDVVEVVGRLRAEYWILRTAHVSVRWVYPRWALADLCGLFAQAWKQSRLDLAEHMFSNGDLGSSRLAPDTAVVLTDTLFEIGRDVFRKRQYEDAVKWLNRAFTVIGERGLEELDHDAVELRLSIMNYLVRACLGVGDRESKEKARGIVDVLELENGDKMAVQLLRLEVLSATSDSGMDVDQYSAVVSRMARSVVLTDASFKTVMHHVHKIKSRSPEVASKVLEKFLQTRLFNHGDAQWIEKVVVTQLWIFLDSASNQLSETLLDLLNVVLQNSRPFGAPATHAAQTLLWKRIEIMYSQGNYQETQSWCNIALHPLFEKAGDLNKAKIFRKMILCTVAVQDHNAARKIFFEMPESAKNAPMTRYLMYKSAIRDSQPKFAAECLDVICRKSDKDANLLYACVIEAQQLTDKRQSILALQKVLEKYESGAPMEINLPPLLRTSIRLLVDQLGDTDGINDNAMDELCKTFEGAAAYATKAMRSHNDQLNSGHAFTVQELEWFSRNSYNISLKYCGSAHPSRLLCLLDKCIQYIGLLQTASSKAQGENGTADLLLRLLLCHYLASSAAIVLARSTDSVQESLTAYTAVSAHAKAFRLTVAPHLPHAAAPPSSGHSTSLAPSVDIGAATRADLAAKRGQLLRYELESAFKKRDWDALDDLWDECFDLPGARITSTSRKNDDAVDGKGKAKAGNWYTRHLETLADLALVIHAELAKADAAPSPFQPEDAPPSTSAHRARILGVLQRIVNQSWQGGGGGGGHGADIVHLARWIRCLFQLSLGGGSGKDDGDAVPIQCVEQATTVISAVGIAASSSSSSSTGRRPSSASTSNRPSAADNGDAADKENAYPLIEAEWLAATAFNHGIEFFCAGDDQRCRLWCDKALGLAKVVEKGSAGKEGGLYGTLMGKYRSLFWDGE